MRRRDLIKSLAGGVTLIWPLAAGAQQAGILRRVAVLNAVAADDKEAQPRAVAFREKLQNLGWVEDVNLKIDFRWITGGPDALRAVAKELVDSKPDVIVAHATNVTIAMRAATTTIPVVFVNVSDPVGLGFVASFARPGSNVTGFTNFDPAMSGKWFSILKEVYPNLARVCLLGNPKTIPWLPRFVPQFEIAAATYGTKMIVTPFQEAAEVEGAVKKMTDEPNSGGLVLPDISTLINRELIVRTIARYNLPAVYPYRYFITAGGLISYGHDAVDSYRGAADYVSRILNGASPAELPVQGPTKFELVVNLKTANAQGVKVSPTLLAAATEIIE